MEVINRLTARDRTQRTLRIVPQNSIHRPQQRTRFTAASVLEVVQIQGPNHTTAESEFFDQFRLQFDLLSVIETHPLVTLVRVGADSSFLILNHRPSFLQRSLAYLPEQDSRELEQIFGFVSEINIAREFCLLLSEYSTRIHLIIR